ncbi:MAG: Verru_Chthon cassette protein C [Verrucomicrobiota bacterium]
MRTTPKAPAFSLVELITAMAIFSILIIMITAVLNNVASVHESARAKADTFQQARNAFETIKRRLAQTTLQTYWDYDYPDNDPTKPPEAYVRQSDLHFVTGRARSLLEGKLLNAETTSHAVFFQSPAGFVDDEELRGLVELLNVTGFFVEYSDGREYSPEFTRGSGRPVRPRLIEAVQSAEKNEVYLSTSDAEPDFRWIEKLLLPDDGGPSNKHVLATNVLALVLRPKLAPDTPLPQNTSTATGLPEFAYDSRAWEVSDERKSRLSRNQLPPVVEVIMVAIDEVSATRLEAQGQDITPAAMGIDALFAAADDNSLDRDLRTLEDRLIELKANFRIFRDHVFLTNSRWSPDN